MGNCTKTAYANEKMANEDIDRIKAKSTRDKKPMRAYHCNKCNLWHLTSTPDFKALYLEQLAENKKLQVKWYTPDQFPEIDKNDKLQCSVDVLMYSRNLNVTLIGYYDFEIKKWLTYGPIEINNFVWSNINLPKK